MQRYTVTFPGATTAPDALPMDLLPEQAAGRACLICGAVDAPGDRLVIVGQIPGVSVVGAHQGHAPGLSMNDLVGVVLFSSWVARCTTCGEAHESVPSEAAANGTRECRWCGDDGPYVMACGECGHVSRELSTRSVASRLAALHNGMHHNHRQVATVRPGGEPR